MGKMGLVEGKDNKKKELDALILSLTNVIEFAKHERQAHRTAGNFMTVPMIQSLETQLSLRKQERETLNKEK